jgi:FkbM family methyltransferase
VLSPLGYSTKLRLAFVARFWRFRKKANFVVRRDGCSIPIYDGMGFNALGPLNAKLGGVVRKLKRRPGHYIDVGANQGQSLLLLAHLGLKIPYRAFEPNPDSAFYLRRLIEENRWPDCEVLPVALGAQPGAAALAFSCRGDESATLSTVVRPQSMYTASVRVPIATGDDMLRDIPAVFLLKVDCEGFEPEVLEGAERFIESRRPPIYFEVLGYQHLMEGSYLRDYFGELSSETIADICSARRHNCLRMDKFFRRYGYSIGLVTLQGVHWVPSIESCLPGSGDMDFLAMQ